MKKFLVVFSIFVVFAMLLASCAPAAAPAEAPKPAPTEAPKTEPAKAEAPAPTAVPPVTEPTKAEAAPAKEIFIGMVQHSSIPFTEQMKNGFEAACKDLKIKCEYAAPETVNPEAAIGMFDAMISKGVQAVILNAAPPEAWTKVIKNATGKGLIINNIDNMAEAAAGANVFVSPALKQSAVDLANEFFSQLKKAGVDKGKVVYGLCAPGYPDQDARAAGWKEVCDKNPSYQCVGPLDSGQSVELSMAFWETEVLKEKDAVGFAGNCAFDGPNLAKIKKTNGSKWHIATFDLEPETLDGIKDGSIDVAMGANPWLNGYLATKLAYEHILSGKPLGQGWVDSGPELVTKDNVTEFLARENDPQKKYEYFKALIDKNFSNLDSMIKPAIQ
jgi:ABC-type sugar transport system substrate-binding protein